MNASDLMTKNPVTVNSSTSIFEAMELMMDKDIRHLPVVEKTELVGVVSDRDLRQFSWSVITEGAGAKDRLRAPVSDLMSGDVLSVGLEADAAEVIDVFVENRVGAVPVVDEVSSDLVGIISYVDVLKHARNVL